MSRSKFFGAETGAYLASAALFCAMMMFTGCNNDNAPVSPPNSGDGHAVKEGVAGKTEDGHDVVVYGGNFLDTYLSEIIPPPEEDDEDEADSGFMRKTSAFKAKGQLILLPLPDDSIPKVGQVIVAGITEKTPYGFLYKVLAVFKTSSNILVDVRRASLDEAIKETDFKGEIDFGVDKDGNLVEMRRKSAEGPGAVTIQASETKSCGSNCSMGVDIKYAVTFIFDTKIKNFKLQRAEMSLEQQADITLRQAITDGTGKINSDKLIASTRLPSIAFYIAGIPVVFTNALEAFVKTTANAEGNLTAEYSLSGRSKFGFKYENGLQPIHELGFTENFSLDQSMSGYARVGILLGVNTMLYDAVGLTLRAGPALQFSVTPYTESGVLLYGGGLYSDAAAFFDDGFQYNKSPAASTPSASLNLGVEYDAQVVLKLFGITLLRKTISNDYTSLKSLKHDYLLPYFDDPVITHITPADQARSDDDINISYKITRGSAVSYQISEYGLCFEEGVSSKGSNTANCAVMYGSADPGRSWRIPETGESVDINYNINKRQRYYAGDGSSEIRRYLIPGTSYTVRPYINTGYYPNRRTFVDKATLFTYMPSYYTLHTTKTTGGTVTLQSDSVNISWGTQVGIKAAPASGYKFVEWYDFDNIDWLSAIADKNSANTTVTVKIDQMIVAAVFEALPAYTVSVLANPAAGGFVDPPSIIESEGTQKNILASAKSGYVFTGWTVEGGPAAYVANANSAATSVTVNANMTVTANFQEIPTDNSTYSLTVNRNPAAGGTVSPATQQTDIAPGTQTAITATPANGYEFVNWTASGGTIANANSAATSVTVNGNTTVTANFQPITYTLAVNRNPAAGGTVSPANQTGITAGTTIPITATQATGYEFVNWTVSGGTVANANSAATSVTVNGNTTVTANFQPAKYTLAVQPNPAVGGTVAPANQTGLAAGTQVAITATPADGYSFVNWTVTGGTVTNANSAATSVTVKGYTTVTANFELSVVTPPHDHFNPNINYGSLSYAGQTYRTVKIGEQTWMAENLNYAGSGGNIGVCYDNSPEKCVLSGRLYSWYEAMGISSEHNSSDLDNIEFGSDDVNHQGICPAGWHISNMAEWQVLLKYADPDAILGKFGKYYTSDNIGGTKLKARSGWGNNSNGTDEFGFSALPGGHAYIDDNFGSTDDYYYYGSWWRATEYSDGTAYCATMLANDDGDLRAEALIGCSTGKLARYSVRCVQD